MGFAGFYFDKFNAKPAFIVNKPDDELSIIVTIPCFKEDNTLKALQGLYYCTPTQGKVEVIVIVNYPHTPNDEYGKQHKEIFSSLKSWSDSHQKEILKFHILLCELPLKDAGVGLARKIVMDEALRRFDAIGRPSGLIVSLDADCTCESNYLSEIENHFKLNPKTTGCSINVEHQVSGDEFEQPIYKAVSLYELYMRYYVAALRFANYPYSFFTIGSAFVVRADIYAKLGGMNRRKAGEDFYFLHKVIPIGHFTELNTTTVYPSSRISDRVPFGTGPEIAKMVMENKFDYLVYNPASFYLIRELNYIVNELYKKDTRTVENIIYKMNSVLVSYLVNQKFSSIIYSCNKNASSLINFKKRFYNWFDGLRVLQCLNITHGKSYKKVSVIEASIEMLRNYGIETNSTNPIDLLNIYRKYQKQIS
jgi:hypothetical protein